jgi:hypothetical protein
MTHSLHRQGKSESLKDDFVLLCTPAKGVNANGAGKKLKKILRIILEEGPANIGFYGIGSVADGLETEAVIASLDDTSRLRCCFDDRDKLAAAVEKIKKGNFGLSIVISGGISEVQDLARELALTPHTIHLSCGILGDTDCLPDEPVLELSTMCGHGLISHRLASTIIQKTRAGVLDIEKAVAILRKPCTCGIFNPTRARGILAAQQNIS